MHNTQIGTLSAAGQVNFNGNADFNGGIFYSPSDTFSSETAIALVLDSNTNRILRRPSSTQDSRTFDERFGYVETKHNNIISETIISPIIDLVTQFINVPSIANQQATILADFVWRLRANNTDSIYCFATNNRGSYWYIPGAASDRNFILIRPTSLRRGLGNGGFIFRCRFALTDNQPDTRIFIGLVSHSNVFDLDGANTLVTADYSLGFIIDYSLNSNYNILLYRTALGNGALHTTITPVDNNVLNDFQIEWTGDNPNVKFSYNGTSTLINIFSSNPPTNVDFHPCINVRQSSTVDWGMFIRQIKCVSYEA
jgi:hypothetical protein